MMNTYTSSLLAFHLRWHSPLCICFISLFTNPPYRPTLLPFCLSVACQLTERQTNKPIISGCCCLTWSCFPPSCDFFLDSTIMLAPAILASPPSPCSLARLCPSQRVLWLVCLSLPDQIVMSCKDLLAFTWLCGEQVTYLRTFEQMGLLSMFTGSEARRCLLFQNNNLHSSGLRSVSLWTL